MTTIKLRVVVTAATTAVLVLTLASPAFAQRGRRARSGNGRAVIVVGGVYGPSYGSWWWGPRGYGPYPRPYGPYVRPYRYDSSSAIRIEVDPRDAEVYLDGYLVGTVDDFDGFFQRLRVRPGEYEIEIFKDGYRSTRQAVYVAPGRTLGLKFAMEPLAPGDPPAARPAERPLVRDLPVGRSAETTAESSTHDRQTGRTSAFGALAIRVQPADAEVIIDGDTWTTDAAGGPLVVQVPAGRVLVEIRKTGLRPFSQMLEVSPDETVALNVSLRPLPPE